MMSVVMSQVNNTCIILKSSHFERYRWYCEIIFLLTLDTIYRTEPSYRQFVISLHYLQFLRVEYFADISEKSVTRKVMAKVCRDMPMESSSSSLPHGPPSQHPCVQDTQTAPDLKGPDVHFGIRFVSALRSVLTTRNSNLRPYPVQGFCQKDS